MKGLLISITLILMLFFGTVYAYNKNLYGVEKIGLPYKIGKKMYYPQKYKSLTQEGYISWYGPGFHSKLTANGAIFDKHTYTAAHKTLQLPAVIEITNLENGKKLIAVVNDRGPFSETQNRILDVSEKIAKDMGFIKKGVIRGKIRYLPHQTKVLLAGGNVKLGLIKETETNFQTTTSKTPAKVINSVTKVEDVSVNFKTNYEVGYLKGKYVQVGAFKLRNNAIKTVQMLEKNGVSDVKIRTQRAENDENIEIIRVGPIEKGLEEEVLSKIKDLGYSDAKILTLN
jgi:rare lipoprotein A